MPPPRDIATWCLARTDADEAIAAAAALEMEFSPPLHHDDGLGRAGDGREGDWAFTLWEGRNAQGRERERQSESKTASWFQWLKT